MKKKIKNFLKIVAILAILICFPKIGAILAIILIFYWISCAS